MSFLRERLRDPRTSLLALVAGLTSPGSRLAAARELAARLGADDLLVFIADREVNALLPAPGFQQTLPRATMWQKFLHACATEPFHQADLFFPDESTRLRGTGLTAEDGSVLVLLGGEVKREEATDVCVLLPIIASAFHGECAATTSAAQATVARDSANEARLLATSLDRARKELRRSLAEARQANAAKDRFLAVLSHELRTPLNPVLMAASAMETDPNIPPEIRADISMIRRNVELEAKLIDDLLDLTRISNGKVQLHRKIVDAHELLEDAISVVRGDPSDAQPEITLELAATRHFVDGDPARIEQIFWNLIRNSVKFTPASGRVTVRTTDAADDILRIEVIDTGIGIAPEALPKIFNAFEQAEVRINHAFGGLGLGLAISQALAEMHGGTICAESAGLGQGASFTFEIPSVAPSAEARAPASHLPTAADSRRILLVEDHATTAALMERLLRKRGHEVEVAHTKSDAIARGLNGEFDIVISDLGLPDGNGYEVMEALRPHSAVVGIALTGYGMEADVALSARAGFQLHLTKPVDAQKLFRAIERIPARAPNS